MASLNGQPIEATQAGRRVVAWLVMLTYSPRMALGVWLILGKGLVLPILLALLLASLIHAWTTEWVGTEHAAGLLGVVIAWLQPHLTTGR